MDCTSNTDGVYAYSIHTAEKSSVNLSARPHTVDSGRWQELLESTSLKPPYAMKPHTNISSSNHPSAISLGPEDALILVDVQVDFLPGGALGVPQASGLLETLNSYLERFVQKQLPVIATRDWHPIDHCSFVDQGGPWPQHCVQQSPGAAFPPQLRLPDNVMVINKATAIDQEAYSGFEGTNLGDTLRDLGVRRVFIAGLATDYCVLATVKDALDTGFTVVLLEDGVRAVDVTSGDGARAIDEMHGRGAIGLRLEALTA